MDESKSVSMVNKPLLSDNHSGSLSSSRQWVEKSPVEMKALLNDTESHHSYGTDRDIEGESAGKSIVVIDRVLSLTGCMTEKYGVGCELNSQKRVMNATRSYIREI